LINPTDSFYDLQIAGKGFVISGAAGDIGIAIAKILKKYGAKVYGCDLRKSDQESLFDYYQILDATKSSDVELFYKNIAENSLCTVICCAGESGEIVDSENISSDRFQSTINSSLLSTALFVKYFTIYFKNKKEGQFILLSSTAGVRGNALMPAYTAAKHGIIGLVRSFARELGPWGIRVNAIMPGLIDSKMALGIHSRMESRVISKLTKQATNLPPDAALQIPIRKIGTPEDIAQAALFLCSPMSTYANACFLNIDGGLLAK
jgi:3-oxoacyl-[acyl-carrier protein] reductase